jgi:hypothetical protein
MRTFSLGFVVVLALPLAALSLGCAGGSSGPKLVWVHEDGTPASRAEIVAARDECIETTDPSSHSGARRMAHIEWAGRVIECVEGKGFKLVDAPDA